MSFYHNRYQPSSTVYPIPLGRPGFFGLNAAQRESTLGPEWASVLHNYEYSSTGGRPVSRKGWVKQNTGTEPAGDGDIAQVFEYRPRSPSDPKIISATSTKLWSGEDTNTEITNSITAPSAGNWQFQNFNGKIVGFQQDHDPIVWDNTGGGFTDIIESAGTVPQGNAVSACYGRIWCSNSAGNNLTCCGLLDETNWDIAGDAYVFNLDGVWGAGQDKIVAISPFGDGRIVVFGENTILIYYDPLLGSDVGLDPNSLVLGELIPNVGCIARDSVQAVGDDLVFLSKSGVLSLGRVLTDKTMPLRGLSQNVKTDIRASIDNDSVANVRSYYAPEEERYLLTFPGAGVSYSFELDQLLPDGSARTTTSSLSPSGWTVKNNGDIILVEGTNLGTVGGYQDNGSSYLLVYESGWIDLDQIAPQTKILKRIDATVFVRQQGTINFKWGFDFTSSLYVRSKQIGSTTAGGEWNIMEWGLGEWGGGSQLVHPRMPASGMGRTLKIGLDVEVDGEEFALQDMTLYFKLGKLL